MVINEDVSFNWAKYPYEIRKDYNKHLLCYYLAEGFRACHYCDILIKCSLRNCPSCGSNLAIKPRTAISKRRYREFLKMKNRKTLAEVEARCSACGTFVSGHTKIQGRNKNVYNWSISKLTGKKLCKACKQREMLERLKNRKCSACGASASKRRMSNHANPKMTEAWYRDGNNGFRCERCHVIHRTNERRAARHALDKINALIKHKYLMGPLLLVRGK